ncbi:MAG TPA: hypothetical protein VFE57_08345, partial [Cyclobacteriaceae bacterium]|nr:hypothetical protein [Cyclobacteriaceae bacterium]
FKKDYNYEGHMRPVRNDVAAHIESFLSYYDTLLSIDSIDAFKTIIAFVNILTKFINFSTSLLNAYQID